MTAPISIIIANYNHAHYLDDALQALLNQTLLPNEIIIVDDASTDNSLDKINQWTTKYPNLIHLHKNEKNQGVLKTIEYALSLSKNDYILFHSADDILIPTALEKFYHMLEQHPQAACCCGEPASFTDNPNDLKEMRTFWSDYPCYISPHELVEKLAGQWIPGYVLLRKQFLLEAGGIIHQLKWHADWFWLLVMSFRHGLCFIPEILALNREDHNSYLTAGNRDPSATEAIFEFLLNLLQQPQFHDILPFFSQSAALANFGSHLAKFVLGRPSLYTPTIIALTQGNIHQWQCELAVKQNVLHIKNKKPGYSEDKLYVLKRIIPKIIDHCNRHQFKNIAISGTGFEVDRIIEQWANYDSPPIKFVVVDKAPDQSTLNTLPIISLDEIASKDIDAIILTSNHSASKIADFCKNSLPSIRLLPLWLKPENPFASRIDNGLENIIPWIAQEYRALPGNPKIALYGAGSHTGKLLEIWRNHGGPDISLIITTQPTTAKSFCGIPVQDLHSVNPSDVQNIILSSYSYEDEMAKNASIYFPNANITLVWGLEVGITI